MNNLLWLSDLNENIEQFLLSLNHDHDKFNFKPCIDGSEKSGEKLKLGFVVML